MGCLLKHSLHFVKLNLAVAQSSCAIYDATAAMLRSHIEYFVR